MSEIFGVRAVDRRGRRRYDPAWKALLVSASLEPGTSVAGLALEHGINANLLRKWIQKHKETPQAGRIPLRSVAAAFIPVQVRSTEQAPVLKTDDAHALEVRSDDLGMTLSEREGRIALSAPVKMSVSLPNGVKLTVECGDAQAVTAVVGAVWDVQTGR